MQKDRWRRRIYRNGVDGAKFGGAWIFEASDIVDNSIRSCSCLPDDLCGDSQRWNISVISKQLQIEIIDYDFPFCNASLELFYGANNQTKLDFGQFARKPPFQ